MPFFSVGEAFQKKKCLPSLKVIMFSKIDKDKLRNGQWANAFMHQYFFDFFVRNFFEFDVLQNHMNCWL